jgi:pimeloyl-ACP methyl ester carboxylesterase
MTLYRYPGETQFLDDAFRATTDGLYADLSHGLTHYELVGPEEGETVVLIHGFSIPYKIWDPVVDALVEEGFKVLRYDLYGRGMSDRPRTRYDHDLFEQQLVELLQRLGLGDIVDIIGLSMGGSISVVFCDRHPGLVRKLVLIDPAGFPFKIPIWAKLLLLPILGEIAFSLIGQKILLSSILKEYYGVDTYPEYIAAALQQMKIVGYRQALLSTIRCGVLDDLSETYHRIGKQNRPTLLIWGTRDRAVPVELSEKVLKAIPHAQFQPIEGAGHVPHYEEPELVNSIIIEFLRRMDQ